MYKVELEVPAQTIADLMVTAIEGGCNYWMSHFQASWIPKLKETCDLPWYAQEEVYKDPDFSIAIFVKDEDEDSGLFILSQAGVVIGLSKLNSEFPEHARKIFEENYDVETADVFLQLCLFGEIVYG